MALLLIQSTGSCYLLKVQIGASESHHMNPSQRTALQVIYEIYFVRLYFREHIGKG